MQTEVWYVMEDGSCGDPREISPDKDGKLKHKDGRAVAYAPHGPRSRSVDPEAEKAKPKGKAEPNKAEEKPVADPAGKAPSDEKPKAEAKPKVETKDMKAEDPKRTYKTRDSKAD